MPSSALKNVATMLALTAMLVRAVLPAGWMPVASGAHAVLVICTIDGPKRIALPDAPLKDHQGGHAGPCAFAAASSPAAIAPPVAMALVMARFDVCLIGVHDVAHVEEGRCAHGARAPPLGA